jgi:predicted nucleotidyltransferase component of viral defense system
MDLKEIRRLVIIALFADDELMEKFVLKGGNALDIIYNIGARSSVDIDLSMPDDFSDLEDAKARIFRALRDRFDSAGFVVFDEKFQLRPSTMKEGQSPRWGGYQVEFKIADRATYEKYKDDIEALRRNASLVGPEQKRTFRVDISKYEFVEPKEETEIDNYTVYVYTPTMLAVEKLRAICQQMPEYEPRRNPKPRARDFYDIHAIVMTENITITTPENIELVRNIFAAKSVPLSLIGNIKNVRDYHVIDWPAVEQSVSRELKDFVFYFDFVVELAEQLQAAGVV